MQIAGAMQMESARKPTRIIGCSVVCIPICILAVCLASWLEFPPTGILARLYLIKVTERDAKGASNLAYFHRPEDDCPQITEQDAVRDIAQFGGAEIKDVSISTYHSTGSDEYYESATINFKYRKPGQQQWSDGKMHLETDANYWGIRFLCGNTLYDHPFP